MGFLELGYFGPNNWENRIRKRMSIYSLTPRSTFWNCEKIEEIKYGQVMRFTTEDFDHERLDTNLRLFYPSPNDLPKELETLPEEPFWESRIPEWRCTSGLVNSKSQTSYQSEIFPLPTKASMMTFHPFIQYGDVNNYLLVINVIKEPIIKKNKINFYNSTDLTLKGSSEVQTNSATCITIDQFNFSPTELPLIISLTCAGIPFGLGVARNGSMLSLEHTHPPASFALFGDRNSIQSSIKKRWFGRLESIK
jgi:hypothetical protein